MSGLVWYRGYKHGSCWQIRLDSYFERLVIVHGMDFAVLGVVSVVAVNVDIVAVILFVIIIGSPMALRKTELLRHECLHGMIVAYIHHRAHSRKKFDYLEVKMVRKGDL